MDNLEIDLLNPLLEEDLTNYYPGVRFSPSNIELMGYLKLFKTHPAEFKELQLMPVFDKTLDKINPDEIHGQCTLHDSHVACFFITKKVLPPNKKAKKMVSNGVKSSEILCDEKMKLGFCTDVRVTGGNFKQEWSAWDIEEIQEYNMPELFEDTVLYRGVDKKRQHLLPAAKYSLFQLRLEDMIEGDQVEDDPQHPDDL